MHDADLGQEQGFLLMMDTRSQRSKIAFLLGSEKCVLEMEHCFQMGLCSGGLLPR